MNVPISASSISKINYSPAVIWKVTVSHTKPLRSASRAIKWRICQSNENHCLCDVIHTLECQDEMGSYYYARSPFEPYLRCSTIDFERPIERSISQLHDSAYRNTVKWRVRTSNANHCMGDVVHTLGCQNGVGSSEPYLRIPTTDLQS